jgi:putative FmdB family regulatory protein
MPRYQYLCSLCEREQLVIKSIKDFDREEHCPVCNTEMSRQISRTSFQLKGGGWAKDLYSSTPKKD